MKRIVQRVTSQTIANSFSSFLILAFSKILFVSPYLITPGQTYDLNGTTTNTTWFYNERNYSLFGTSDIPYFVFTLIILVLFVLLPNDASDVTLSTYGTFN